MGEKSMPHDEPFTPPRKKIKIFWWLGGVFLLLALLFLLQLFGPNPPIAVSPQTTFITEPIGPDGLPDYERYVLDLSRDGVTPENNAMTLLWPVLFPAEVQPEHFAAITMELGLEQIPSKEDALEPLHSDTNRGRVAALLKERAGLPADGNAVVRGYQEPVWIDGDSSPVNDLLEQAKRRPWTSDQLPPLAEWVRKNKKPLDLIVEASKRPRYYAPSPTLIDNNRNLLIEMLLPLSQSARETGRALSARAMWHVGEGRAEEAWQDVLAIHRLSHLFAQGNALVEQLIALATSSAACEATITLLDSGTLTAEQARAVQRELAALPNFAVMARSLDVTERAAALNAFIRVGTGGGGEMFSAISGVQDNDFGNNVFDVVSVDWNLVLRETNQWYDRLAAAAKLPDYGARAAALQKVEADMQQLVAEARIPATWLAGLVSRQQRSKLVSSIMLGLFLPAVNAATAAEDRANAMLDLVRLAAALAVYRAEHGAYPDKLDELVPSVLPALPVDLYNAKPYTYKRDVDGYLLYSLGGNGTDDGGSNEQMRLLNGTPIDELNEAVDPTTTSTIPNGADDMSIRLPRPAIKMPELSQPPGEL
jgi:hypothetical protein